MYIVQDTFIEVPDSWAFLCGSGVVGHHDNGLMRFTIESIHQFEDLLSRNPVEVSGWLICNQYGRVGDNGAGDRNPLLLSS